jgi:type II secretory pathway pseudopilin PulG
VKINRIPRAFTRTELIVSIVIITALVGLIIPAVDSAREAGRRLTCLSNLRCLGLSFANYAYNSGNAYPPSASLTKSPTRNTYTVGGWSLTVRLLPFNAYDSLYKTLPTSGDPEDTTNPAIVAAMNTQLPDCICPSSPGRPAGQSAGITNYKAMGASTRDSLLMAADPTAKPPYGIMPPPPGQTPLHPDGAIFPGTSTRAADVTDGLSHTIFLIETIDQRASRWTVGKEATLVGLPQKCSPRGASPQPPYDYFAPPDYDGLWGPDSGVAKAGLRTFLTYDFSPRGADAGKYEDPGFGQVPPDYGPSSMHPTVVNCDFGDGSVQAISKQVDAANLFFLITKSGKDPFCLP